MNQKIIKILSAVFLFVFVFNFIHSEIISQFEGKDVCHTNYDYCKLVAAASIKTSSSYKVVIEEYVLIDFICQHCLKQIENGKSFYQKHQNFSFNHLELEASYLFNKSFLI